MQKLIKSKRGQRGLNSWLSKNGHNIQIPKMYTLQVVQTTDFSLAHIEIGKYVKILTFSGFITKCTIIDMLVNSANYNLKHHMWSNKFEDYPNLTT